MSYDNIHMPEGNCEIALPDKLSSESVRDVEEWLNLILRRLKRRAYLYSEFLPEVPWFKDEFLPEIPWKR